MGEGASGDDGVDGRGQDIEDVFVDFAMYLQDSVGAALTLDNECAEAFFQELFINLFLFIFVVFRKQEIVIWLLFYEGKLINCVGRVANDVFDLREEVAEGFGGADDFVGIDVWSDDAEIPDCVGFHVDEVELINGPFDFGSWDRGSGAEGEGFCVAFEVDIL